MAPKPPNDRLARLMAAAGFTSRKAFARAVLDESRVAGQPLRACDHTYVTRWLDGMVPRGQTPTFIASALGKKLLRSVTLSEIGMATAGSAGLALDVGLTYSGTAETGTESVVRLWNADLDTRTGRSARLE
jgi:hypothetical protein